MSIPLTLIMPLQVPSTSDRSCHLILPSVSSKMKILNRFHLQIRSQGSKLKTLLQGTSTKEFITTLTMKMNLILLLNLKRKTEVIIILKIQ